jgi:DNA-directed RNA polymerase sigma subunit (sigma70/sigma32)
MQSLRHFTKSSAQSKRQRLPLALPKLSLRSMRGNVNTWRHRMLTDEPETLGEISRRFQISRERVRQIELGLKVRLRDALVELASERRAA